MKNIFKQSDEDGQEITINTKKQIIMSTFNHKSGQYFNIHGAEIYYEEIGDKEKPVLLMLHGGMGNIEDLNPIAAYLSAHFYIIGIDSRGHGKSTLGDEKLTYEQMQNDVEAILQQLKIDTISIVGFSDGGIVAYRIASRKKIKVDKLITMGSSWSNNDVIKVEGIFKTITPEKAQKLFQRNYESYMQLNSKPEFATFTQSLVTMWLDKTETGHPNESVREISAQTLLIRGDNDFLVSLESLVELKDKIKGASFFNVPFAEHVVYEWQPQVIEIILKQFLIE